MADLVTFNQYKQLKNYVDDKTDDGYIINQNNLTLNKVLELETMLKDDRKPIFVFDNNGVLGYAFCMVTEVKDDILLQDIKTLYIDDICVDEKARGQHVGKALYEYVRDYAQSIGCNNVTLNVWDGNDAALSFYRNMGMKVQKTTMEIVL